MKKTRSDIPEQLPGSFDSEALELRNQLLDWRLRNFEVFDYTEPAEISIKLSTGGIKLQPRTMQIISPLLVIARRLKNPAPYIRHLLQFASSNEGQTMEVLRDSW